MTYILGFISQKGGVGKSTLSRAVAAEISKNKLSVKLSDLDIQQATTSNWHRRRLIEDIKSEISIECHKTVFQSLQSLHDHDVLIIDGPARASRGTLEIAQHANLIIQPTGCCAPAILVTAIKLRKFLA